MIAYYNMIENVFEIKQLKCSYNNQNPVLEVDNLSIPRGKLVMLLGKSGSGKSTFLETLGLMNNTIHSGEINFNPSSTILENYSFQNLWNMEKSSVLAKIRAEHMSFVFQNTNLMPNFNVNENILLAPLIKGNDPLVAMKEVKLMMNAIGISDLKGNEDVTKLSGGQRQRIAFVRAICNTFTVLFGDEPTGNLDAFNSNDLMILLSDTIKKRGKTAIVVTHNIEMAVDFADIIIIITKTKNEEVGKINSKNVLYRQSDNLKLSQWVTGSGATCNDPLHLIRNLMNENSITL